MAEINFGEVMNEISRDREIQPHSKININDCEHFWKGVFGKEIESVDLVTKEVKKNNLEPDIVAAKDFWEEVFGDFIQSESIEGKKELLSIEEKNFIKEDTGWSDEIIDALRTMDEYEIYKEAGLIEGEVNGKKCLMRNDIDWEQKDQFGYTNRERVAGGYAPLDKNGKPIQLHHIGQHADSPLAELTFKEHRTGGNDTILHDKTKETEVHGEGSNWDNERQDYWKNRKTDGGVGSE